MPDSVIQRLLDEHDGRDGDPREVENEPQTFIKDRHMKNEDFHHEIVEILDAKGPMQPRAVISEIARTFIGQFSSWDLQKQPSGKVVRWINRVYDAKDNLKQWGLVMSVDGRWQITEYGRKALADGTI